MEWSTSIRGCCRWKDAEEDVVGVSSPEKKFVFLKKIAVQLPAIYTVKFTELLFTWKKNRCKITAKNAGSHVASISCYKFTVVFLTV